MGRFFCIYSFRQGTMFGAFLWQRYRAFLNDNMKDELQILTDLGYAVDELCRINDLRVGGRVDNAELKSHIRNLKKQALKCYTTESTRLRRYIMARSSSSKEHEVSELGIVAISVMCFRFFFKDNYAVDLNYIARCCFHADGAKHKSIRYYHLAIYSMIYAGTLQLKPKEKRLGQEYLPAVVLHRNVIKDALGACPLLTHSDVVKEYRVQ